MLYTSSTHCFLLCNAEIWSIVSKHHMVFHWLNFDWCRPLTWSFILRWRQVVISGINCKCMLVMPTTTADVPVILVSINMSIFWNPRTVVWLIRMIDLVIEPYPTDLDSWHILILSLESWLRNDFLVCVLMIKESLAIWFLNICRSFPRCLALCVNMHYTF